MGASQILRRFFLIVGVLIFLFRKWKASDTGRYHWDRFKLKVKVFGPLCSPRSPTSTTRRSRPPSPPSPARSSPS